MCFPSEPSDPLPLRRTRRAWIKHHHRNLTALAKMVPWTAGFNEQYVRSRAADAVWAAEEDQRKTLGVGGARPAAELARGHDGRTKRTLSIPVLVTR